jgi:solute carrier family 35, member E3
VCNPVCDLFADKFQVFTNKAIFEDASLRLNQSTFAAFHFSVTGATLYAISRPSMAIFAPCRARIFDMMPLALAMCMNVILPNLSLAFSTVAFYQIVRVLLTPLVAGINFIVYEIRVPKKAVWTLAPICVGVALVSYYDTKSVEGAHVKSTSTAGVAFAFAGVIASSFYTVWIGNYQKKFDMSSMQLLFNQAPISAFLLLYVIPFTDQPPVWSEVPVYKWKLIAMVRVLAFLNLDASLSADTPKSGVLASLINISQFYIVAGAGAVSSTVVGHIKTCSIVALGWAMSGRKACDRSLFGIVLAISGILA